MGRLAVDSSHQDKGLGTTLLQDALMSIEQAGDMIAIRALLVQAINNTARDFYLRFGFSPSPNRRVTAHAADERLAGISWHPIMKLPAAAYSAKVATSATKAGSYGVFGGGE